MSWSLESETPAIRRLSLMLFTSASVHTSAVALPVARSVTESTSGVESEPK